METGYWISENVCSILQYLNFDKIETSSSRNNDAYTGIGGCGGGAEGEGGGGLKGGEDMMTCWVALMVTLTLTDQRTDRGTERLTRSI